MHQHTFRRFLALARPQRGQIVLGIVLILVATALTLPAPWIFKILIDDALPRHDLRLLGWLLVAFTVIFSLRAWITFVRNRILQYAAMRLVCDVRIQLFAHLQRLSLRYFDANQTGKTASRISQDTNEVYALTNNFLITVISDAITLLGVLAFLFFIEWHLALAVAAVLPLFLVNHFHQRSQMREESRVHRKNWDHVVGFLHEKVAAARVVKSFTKEQDEIAAFAAGINADYNYYSKIVIRYTKIGIFADLLGSLGTLVVLGYGGWLVIEGRMPVGTLVAFYGYIAFIFPPIVRFADLNLVLQRATTSLENIFALLDTQPEVTDAPAATPLPPVRGDVAFVDVCFDYDREPPGAGRPRTLTNVSFAAPAGTLVAIVGPSGAGKSTLVNLIARFYDPASGAITIDGHDIRAVTTASLRGQIGIVLQENILFSGTLEENLKYGRPDATREQIVEAAKAANAHEFIAALPDGYASTVGERGVKLSGGQRQRIAIARAILKDPRILIFDEATSALDTASERLIQQAMERLMHGRTTFVIAHRLSTIQKADTILVMDQGRLAEHGTHAELLARGGLYARLHALQFQELE
jgi:subfamily B ATP-binding cassette protein MsbA